MGGCSTVRARLVDSNTGFSRLLPAWWELLDRAACPQPSRTPLWQRAWWSVFGGAAGRKLSVVVVESGADVIGIVPLSRRWAVRGGVLPVRALELVGSGEPEEDEIFSEYIGAIAAAGREEEVAAGFAELCCSGEMGPWEELIMPAMSSEDPMVPCLRDALSARGAQVDVRATHECPYVSLPPTWDDYLARLEGQRRYLVRRTLRDLRAFTGEEPALHRASSSEEMARAWSTLKELHAERWGGPGVFGSERFCRFHEAVMPELLRGHGGTLDLLCLTAGGRPIAAAYNLVYRGHVQFYQSGRKMDVPKGVRPGLALQILAIRRAIEAGCKSYDFLAQADQYKQKLSFGESRHLLTLSAVAPTLRARASSDVRRTARKLWSLTRRWKARPRTAASPAPPRS